MREPRRILDRVNWLGLATIALGNGLFLPSLPSQINDLYRPDDPRRGWAYNVYYVGINIGGFLAPLICGTLGELYILPTGLGLFARLAPPALGATTIAGWFLAIFTGSLAAGFVGTLWSRTSHPAYFAILAAIAAVAAMLLLALDRATRRAEIERAATILMENT